MHYKNFRLARLGDLVIFKSWDGNIKSGVLSSANAGSTSCNGMVTTPLSAQPESVNIGDLYHVEDAYGTMEAIGIASPSYELGTGSVPQTKTLGTIATLLILLFVLCASAFKSQAQSISQFGQPTLLTVPTNSGPIQTTPFQVYVPPISLTITATNPLTIVTNVITQVITFTNTTTFIYNAAIYGMNFSTNWLGYYALVTNSTVGWAFPQSSISNAVYIK